jgi:hypothetical protein
MAFDARSLRVQLPCGTATVMEAERHDAEVKVRRATSWVNILIPSADKDCSECGSSTQLCGHGSDKDLGLLCHGTDPLDFRVVVDAHVLPVLREQLAARLKELDKAIEAVARKKGRK